MSNTSLLQYFEPPAEFIGYLGLVCGYDAADECARNMVERFCNLAMWSPQGFQPLVFMVDASSGFKSCPEDGWLRLYQKHNYQRPYRMLHAKVALLAFQSINNPAHWRIRLLVSTGNWTNQTVNDSLDLMWSVEVDSLTLGDATACADIKAAWKMMRWLSELHNTSILKYTSDTSRISVNAERWKNYCSWLDHVGKKASGQPRFFDNRQESLLAQLPTQIKEHAKGGRRSYLAMGSGFFESSKSVSVPDVLQKIVETLQADCGLLKSAEVEIIVNELSCQGIAHSKDKVIEKKWMISCPVHKLEPHRTLHAKFLFSAYDDGEKPHFCLKPWVYLGSGNLTHPGFASKMSRSGGNLEAGVVFHPGKLTWYPNKDYACISEFLPISWPRTAANLENLANGADFPDKGEDYPAPPVSFALWQGPGLRLPVQEDPSVPCQIIASDKKPCVEQDGLFIWPASRPSKVDICWYEDGARQFATVPVIDEFGNVGAIPAPAQSIAEALDRLGDFPLLSCPDDPENEGDDNTPDGSGEGGSRSAAPAAPAVPYPVRTIMSLVERIAEKQTSLTEAEWPRWCMQLEQTFVAMKDNNDVAAIVAQLNINPLQALYAAPFRPSFAEHADTEASKMYEHTIAAIESAWGLQDKQALGVEI